MANKEIPKLFFVHIPKTAGTSLRIQLKKFYTEGQVFPSDKDITKASRPYRNAKGLVKSVKENPDIRFIAGHFPYATSLKVDNDFQKIFCLRDPIRRTVSNILHLKRKENPKLNPGKLFNKNIKRLDNRQVRFLLSKANLNEALTQADLEDAINNLKKDNTTFGIVEKYEDSLQLISHKLGFKFEETVNVNRNPRKDQTLGPKLLEKIKEANKWDLLLYAEATKIFDDKIKALKSS